MRKSRAARERYEHEKMIGQFVLAHPNIDWHVKAMISERNNLIYAALILLRAFKSKFPIEIWQAIFNDVDFPLPRKFSSKYSLDTFVILITLADAKQEQLTYSWPIQHGFDHIEFMICH